MALRSYSGNAKRTTLTGDITASSMTFTVSDATGYPAPTGGDGPFVVTLDLGLSNEEKILVSSRSSSTFTVSQRGFDGTTATTHGAGGLVDHTLSATDVRELNEHVYGGGDSHADKLDVATATATYGLSVKSFGAVGDGVTDDTAAIKAAIAAAAGQQQVVFGPGEFLITDTLTGTPAGATPIHLRGAGSGLTTLIHGASGKGLIEASGDIGASVAFTAATAAGAQTITLSSAAGIAAGDFLFLRDPTQPILGGSTRIASGVAGEVLHVRSVSGNNVTFYGRAEFAYTTSADARRLTLVDGISVTGMSVLNRNPGTQAGGSRFLGVNRARRVVVRDVVARGLDDDAIRLDTVIDFNLTDLSFIDMADLESPDNNPYGINLVNGCAHGVVSNCSQRYGRHLFTAGGGSATEPQPAHVLVADSIATECSQAAFDTHPGARFITFDNCTVHASAGAGFQVRGPDSSITGATVRQAPTGVSIVNGADRCRVSDSVFDSCDVGVNLQHVADIHVRDVRIVNPLTNGISVPANNGAYGGAGAGAKRLVFQDVDITGNPTGAAVLFSASWDATNRIERLRAPSATTKLSGVVQPILASAATMTFPDVSNVWTISGTANITTITTDVLDAGRVLTLVFQSTATVTDGSNLKLVGSFPGGVNSTLTLVSTGALWLEVARAVTQ